MSRWLTARSLLLALAAAVVAHQLATGVEHPEMVTGVITAVAAWLGYAATPRPPPPPPPPPSAPQGGGGESGSPPPPGSP